MKPKNAHFSALVEYPDGRRGRIVIRNTDAPADLNDEELLAWGRKQWAKGLQGVTVLEAVVIGPDEPSPEPHPGMFPSGEDFKVIPE